MPVVPVMIIAATVAAFGWVNGYARGYRNGVRVGQNNGAAKAIKRIYARRGWGSMSDKDAERIAAGLTGIVDA